MNIKFVSLAALLSLASIAADAKGTLLVNRIAPSVSELFIANADGSGERRLLRDSKLEYDASFSADGQWIAFTSERNGSADLYRVRSDGSGFEQLTADAAFDDQAAFSADNKQIAFVSTRGTGSTHIWVLDLTNQKLRNVTGGRGLRVPDGRLAGYFRPQWSPDGQWLAFASDRDTAFEDRQLPAPGWEHLQRSAVYVIRADGSELRKLSNESEYAGSPKWSADGTQVVFYSMDAAHTFAARTSGNGVQSQIVAVNVSSGERKELTSGPGLKVSPQFVGSRVGYLSDKRSSKGQLAYTDGSAASTAGVVRNPAWSPDGQQVVYQKMQFAPQQNQSLYGADPTFALRYSGAFPAVSSNRKVALTPSVVAGASVPADATAVYVSDLDGANLTQIFKKDGGVFAPTWSPDGQSLAVSHGASPFTREYRPAQILTMKADGSEARALTDGKLDSGAPSFAPDGKRIVFRVWSEQERGLRILNLDDNSIASLTVQNDNFPSWSPKGDRICFSRNVGGEQFDIFTIRPDGTDLRQLSETPGDELRCTWSADQKQIVFTSSRFGFRDEAPLYDDSPQPYLELFIMRDDGKDPQPLSNDKWEDNTPAWVP